MTAPEGTRPRLAGLARQTRTLLERLSESRWPGFEPPPLAGSPPPTPARREPRGGERAPQVLPAVDPPAAAAPRWGSLEQVAEAVAGCAQCPLHATRANVVPGEGNPRARLMFVGEAPGADEDQQGRPFVGKAGQLLDRMIAAMGLARGEVFIANVLKCRPPGNRDPQPSEVAACLPYLQAQIALVDPEVLCTLGKHSLQALTGRRLSIMAARGRFIEYGGRPLMPTFHPSYLLRSPEDKAKAWKDLQQVMERLGLPLPSGPGAARAS